VNEIEKQFESDNFSHHGRLSTH